jgi:hypothetical protein
MSSQVRALASTAQELQAMVAQFVIDDEDRPAGTAGPRVPARPLVQRQGATVRRAS